MLNRRKNINFDYIWIAFAQACDSRIPLIFVMADQTNSMGFGYLAFFNNKMGQQAGVSKDDISRGFENTLFCFIAPYRNVSMLAEGWLGVFNKAGAPDHNFA